MNKTTLNSQKEKHSMLSLRRATSVALPGLRLHLDFYPRSPCGERLNLRVLDGSKSSNFYPRSPCGERRGSGVGSWPRVIFLSTLSLRRATSFSTSIVSVTAFLSTLSLRRATYLINTYHRIFGISIHALLAESDQSR